MLPIALRLLFFSKLVKFFKDVDLSKNCTLDLIWNSWIFLPESNERENYNGHLIQPPSILDEGRKAYRHKVTCMCLSFNN